MPNLPARPPRSELALAVKSFARCCEHTRWLRDECTLERRSALMRYAARHAREEYALILKLLKEQTS